MPHATHRGDRFLALELTEKHAFYSGQTIIGNVTRWARIVDSEAVLKLELRGSAKVKITHGSGNNRRSYSQRINFWRHPIVQELYRGPIHIPDHTEEPLRWHFAVEIPTQADDSMFARIDKKAYYLKGDDPESYRLPPTFSSGLGGTDEFYIEYVLVATLIDSKREESESVHPVTIRRSFTPTPISEFGLKDIRGLTRSVSTFQLDPEYADAELSFKQRAKVIFGSSKVPTLIFRLSVQQPTVLQIGHPEPAPFHVRAIMTRDKTSDVVQDPPIFVTRFKVKLDEVTTAVAPGTLSIQEDTNKEKWTLLDWRRKISKPAAPRTPSRQPSPAPGSSRGSTSLNIGEEYQAGPSTQGPSTKESAIGEAATRKSGSSSVAKDSLAPPEYEERQSYEEPPPPDAETLIIPWETALLPLDLGKALDLRVPLRPRFHSNDIQPSLTAISIKAVHMLRWELEVDIAGEDVEFSGTQRIEVLGQSDDDPTNHEPPPPPSRGPWVA
ncbi:hypothetical protein NLU13_0115 [Sarocladium strictum]|uniref:Arrestin-like N-terminal domain-containing protein n=1 Tax=Sarocladium strictum TaxID=5046 RepID=A0AA39GP75_SARSR|nr:hypothetical protein NLU13_0115 [Sarocladium strictum]